MIFMLSRTFLRTQSFRLFSRSISFIIAFFFAFTFAAAQPVLVDSSGSAAEMEKVLVALADTMIARGYNVPGEGYEPESVFQQNLILALRSPKTFSHTFPKLQQKDRIDIAASDDGLFRIFNWLSPTTGTMYDFGAIIQAKSMSGKVLVYDMETRFQGQEQPPAIPGYLHVYRLPARNRQLYLAIATGQYSGLLPYYTVEAFEIRNDTLLTDVAIFPGKEKVSSLLHLGIELRNDGKGTRRIPEPSYDPKKAILTIPKIDDYKLSGKSGRMKFNGRFFIKLN